MPQSEEEPQPIGLTEFFAVVRRRKWSVIIPTVLVLGAALALVFARTATYASTARVQVLAKFAQQAVSPGFGPVESMDTEAGLVTSTEVEGRAAVLLVAEGYDAAIATDADVSVAVPTNTTYLDITCTTEDAESAQACAQAYAEAYAADRKATAADEATRAQARLKEALVRVRVKLDAIGTLIAKTTDPDELAQLADQQSALLSLQATNQADLNALPTASAVPAKVVTPANLPTEPSNKDYVTTGILALILGLALGIGLAFVRQRMDARVGEREGLDLVLGTPVLAVVPHVKGRRRSRESTVDSVADPEGRAAEAYRSARPVLLHRAREHDVKTILVTGPGQGEGKSTTTANLGVVLARSGYRVAMLSCDLRKPALHRLFGLPSEPGLADVLQHKIALRDALIRTGVPNLLLLPSGVAPANPSELLGSGAMAAVVTELRANADFLLLDTPPSLVVGDALELAPIADAVLVVVDGSATTEANVVRWRAQLDQVGGHLLGCVLNNLDPKAVARYGSYYSAAYRYGGPPTGGRRREDREREGWGRLGTFPPGASEVNVSLGPAFAGFDENANGRGSGPPPEMPEPETVPKLDGVGDGDGEPRPS